MIKKGIIAFDIDGTLTAMRKPLAKEVKIFLEELEAQGFRLLFATGRVFSWSYHLLEELKIPYILAVQNGSLVIDMPSQKILFKNYISKDLLLAIDALVLGKKAETVIYSGYDLGEICYFVPADFSDEKFKYVQTRAKAFNETWAPLKTIGDYPQKEFASIRSFVDRNIAYTLSQELKKSLDVEAFVMIDSFDERRAIVQITKKDVSKGSALKAVIDHEKITGKVIACGDDYNDIPMFKIADISVVMETAPKAAIEFADIIAKRAEDLGIIEGVKKALNSAG